MFDMAFFYIWLFVLCVFMIGTSIFEATMHRDLLAPQNRFNQSGYEQSTQYNFIMSKLSAGNICWNRIIVASPEHFYKKWLLNPIKYKGFGLLRHYANSVEIYALLNRKETNFSFTKAELHIEWLSFESLYGSEHNTLKLTQGKTVLFIRANSSAETFDIARMLNPHFVLPPAKIIEKKHVPLMVMILCSGIVGIGVLGLLPYILSSYHFVNSMILFPWLMIAALAAGGCNYAILKWLKRPALETTGLSILMILSFFLCSGVIISYMDQYLLGSSIGVYSYTYKGNDEFEPLDIHAPPLSLEQIGRRTSAYSIGSIHRFSLLHGLLGTWQLDLEFSNQFHISSQQPVTFTRIFTRWRQPDFVKALDFTLLVTRLWLIGLLIGLMLTKYLRQYHRINPDQNKLVAALNPEQTYWWQRVYIARLNLLKQHTCLTTKFETQGLIVDYHDCLEVQCIVEDQQLSYRLSKQQLTIEKQYPSVTIANGIIYPLKLSQGNKQVIIGTWSEEKRTDLDQVINKHFMRPKPREFRKTSKEDTGKMLAILIPTYCFLIYIFFIG
ncbi:MAG: hypothetical protein HOP02_04290 [Methylococcaceae bacterium]|nr:hypothetical protein [Methylococcaceae bacterium]